MDALGHEQFAVYGTDTGCRSPTRWRPTTRSGSSAWSSREAFLPGISPPLPLFVPPPLNARLWHLMFNQLPAEVNEALVSGREEIFFGAEFDASAGTTKLPEEAVKYYVETLAPTRTPCAAASASTARSRRSAAQNEERKARRLTMPVLAMGGEESGRRTPRTR